MTDEQILKLVKEHGVWGWMDSQLDKRWKQFQESFNE